MGKFIFGDNVFTPVDTILGVDCDVDTEVTINCINHNTEAGATDVVQSKYVLTVNSGKEVTVGKRLAEELNFGKLEVIDLVEFEDEVTSVTFTADGSDTSSNGLSAGAGITGGSGTVFHSWRDTTGNIVKTSIFLELTDLQGSATAGDIVGQGTDAAHIGQITAARNGTIFFGKVTCFEVPTTNLTTIDLYSADEATGAFDGAIGDLTETQLLDAAAFAADDGAADNSVQYLSAYPAANEYLYLVSQDTTAVTATAGKLLIELYGTL